MYVNAKIIPLKLLKELGKEGVKESNGRGEFKYDIFDTL
jgi:hypothetical protein